MAEKKTTAKTRFSEFKQNQNAKALNYDHFQSKAD